MREGLREHLPEVSRVKGLGQSSVKTDLGGLRFVHFLERARHENEADLLEIRVLVDGAFDFEGGFTRERNIDQYGVGTKKRDLLDRIVSIGNGLDFITFVGKRKANNFLNGQTVVRYKKFFACHYV